MKTNTQNEIEDMTLEPLIKESSSDAIEINLSEQSLFERVQNFRETHPTTSTVLESAAVYAGNRLLMRLGERYGLSLGHGRQNNELRKNIIDKYPKTSILLIGGVAPVAEEFIFRKLPSDKLDSLGDTRPRWDIGTLIGVGFMAIHAGKDGIPIPQLVVGQNAWRVQRQRGHRHAVLAHLTNNALHLLSHSGRGDKK